MRTIEEIDKEIERLKAERDLVKKDCVRAGETFRSPCGGIYIVAQVGTNEFSLISLRNGNRWEKPVRGDDGCVSLNEMVGTGIKWGHFTPIRIEMKEVT